MTRRRKTWQDRRTGNPLPLDHCYYSATLRLCLRLRSRQESRSYLSMPGCVSDSMPASAFAALTSSRTSASNAGAS